MQRGGTRKILQTHKIARKKGWKLRNDLSIGEGVVKKVSDRKEVIEREEYCYVIRLSS